MFERVYNHSIQNDMLAKRFCGEGKFDLKAAADT